MPGSGNVVYQVAHKISTIRCTSEYFEEQGNGIVEFSKAMSNVNEDIPDTRLSLSRKDIEGYFWMEVNRVYARGDPYGDAQIEKLLGQVSLRVG